MAALGLLQSMLGFNETLQALMIALYIAMDSFGTAWQRDRRRGDCVVVDKIAGKQRLGQVSRRLLKHLPRHKSHSLSTPFSRIMVAAI